MFVVQADLQTAQMIAREAQKARTDAETRRNAAEKKIRDLQDNVSLFEHRLSRVLTYFQCRPMIRLSITLAVSRLG
jgi:hypothetical protein